VSRREHLVLGSLAGVVAALPLAVVLAGLDAALVGVGALVAAGALFVVALETGVVPVSDGAFYRWGFAAGLLTTAGWRGGQLPIPPTDPGPALAYYVLGLCLAVPVAGYDRVWAWVTAERGEDEDA